MPDVLVDFYESISSIDLFYLILTIFSLIKCYKKGFVLSILSMAKWLLAYVITLIIFPRIKPYLENIIDNEYVPAFVEIKETHVQELMVEVEISGLESIDDQEKLLSILGDLKPDQAEIIEMRFFFSYSFKEIADFYKISEANAKMRLYRILDKLKQKWSNQ